MQIFIKLVDLRKQHFSLLILLGAIVFFVWESRAIYPQIDDAYISYRYAENFVNGHGLVYNIGERVEGYTNLLWTLLVALGLIFGGSAELIGHLLGFLSGIALLIGSYLYARAVLVEKHSWLAGFAPCLVLLSNPFAAWTASGLETPLFATFVIFAFYFQVRARMAWGTVICILATLTRPEGALLALVVLGGIC